MCHGVLLFEPFFLHFCPHNIVLTNRIGDVIVRTLASREANCATTPGWVKPKTVKLIWTVFALSPCNASCLAVKQLNTYQFYSLIKVLHIFMLLYFYSMKKYIFQQYFFWHNHGWLAMELQLHQQHDESGLCQCIVVCSPINHIA